MTQFRFGTEWWWTVYSRIMEKEYGKGVNMQTYPPTAEEWHDLAKVAPDLSRLNGLTPRCCNRELLPMPHPHPDLDRLDLGFRYRYFCPQCGRVWMMWPVFEYGTPEYQAEMREMFKNYPAIVPDRGGKNVKGSFFDEGKETA